MAYIRKTRFGWNKWIMLCTVIGALSLAVLLFYFFIAGNKEGKMLAQSSMTFVEKNEMSIVRANRAIQAGENADIVKFEVVAVPSELVPEGAVISIQQLRNKRIASAIAAKEFLLQRDLVESAEWYGEEDRLIEHTFQEGAVPATVDAGSVVDIKLFRPKFEDEVVIAKTVVIAKVEKTLSFYLDKTEQESIKEASTEGFLFLVQYLDKAQPSSIVTYLPSHESKNLKLGAEPIQ